MFASIIQFPLAQIEELLLWNQYDVDIDCAAAIISYIHTGKLKITRKTVPKIPFFSRDMQPGEIFKLCCNFFHNRGLMNNKGPANYRKFCLDLMQSQIESYFSTSLCVRLASGDLQSVIFSDVLEVDSKEHVFGVIKRFINTDDQTDFEDELTNRLKCIRWNRKCEEFRGIHFEDGHFVHKDLSCGKYLLNVNAKYERDLRNEGERIIITFGRQFFRECKEEWIAKSYDPATEQSRMLAHLTLRNRATVVPVGGEKVMIVGGEVNYKVSPYVDMFFCQKKQSRPMASLNYARWDHGACAVGDAVIVCGGCGKISTFLKSCEVFFEDRWSLLPDMNEARSGVSVVSSSDRRVFAIGGHNGNRVEFCRLPVDFDSSPPSSEGFWRSLASMREDRYGPAALLFQEILFVAGGVNNRGALSSVECLSIANETSQWISLSVSMENEKSEFSLLIYCREIFAFGNGVFPYNLVERLQFSRNLNSGAASTFHSVLETFAFSHWESLSPISSMDRVCHAVLIPISQ